MKFNYFVVVLFLLFTGCQPQPDNSAEEAFKKNSETVMAYLKAFQNEAVDYSIYADDFIMRDTGFGTQDSITLDQLKENDKNLWAAFDLKLIDIDSTVLLPGVNTATKLPDGSVRYYGDWEVTLPATDSTEARTGILKAYESFDFNEEGKILYQQTYGDFTGLMMHLQSPMEVEDQD